MNKKKRAQEVNPGAGEKDEKDKDKSRIKGLLLFFLLWQVSFVHKSVLLCFFFFFDKVTCTSFLRPRRWTWFVFMSKALARKKLSFRRQKLDVFPCLPLLSCLFDPTLIILQASFVHTFTPLGRCAAPSTGESPSPVCKRSGCVSRYLRSSSVSAALCTSSSGSCGGSADSSTVECSMRVS